ARAVGRDINPVSVRSVSAAMRPHFRRDVEEAFRRLREAVERPLRQLYTTAVDGADAEILYIFWVMTAACPSCQHQVDLFSTHTFARHAYSARFPAAQSVCPHCGFVTTVRADTNEIHCVKCQRDFSSTGAARGAVATCPK